MDAILVNSQGLRAGWRLALYALLVFAVGIASMLLFEGILGLPHDIRSPAGLLFRELWSFSIVFGSALIMARVEHRPAGVYGLPLEGMALTRLVQGWLLGLGEISLLVGLIWAFGGYSFGTLAIHGSAIAGWGAMWLVVFLAVGLFEEFTFRGYSQFTLGDGIGFWPAAILLSAAFGAVHLRNQGENWTGAAGAFLVGMVFAFSLLRTGNLWLAVGMHASFDFGETFLYSVPNSGFQFPGHLSNATLAEGRAWLTGGAVGPEGSVFSFLTLLLVALAIHVWFPRIKSRSQLSTGGY
jgi:uncharacterized protein